MKRLLLAITLIIMCFFGFTYDTSLYSNTYSYPAGMKGIHFEPYSMAYTERFPEVKTESFVMKFTISPDFPKPTRFGMILQIYDREDNAQIAVGQWENSLVILNSDDYSNSRKLPKMYIPMDKDSAKREVSIHSGSGGTSVSIDKELVGENPELHLVPPASGKRAHLIVGNGINGLTPWKGTMHSLAFYGKDIEKPILQYDLMQVEDSFIVDQSDNRIDLYLPQEVHPLKKTILRFPKLQELNLGSIAGDLFLNFFGFVPLGFLLVVNLTGKKSRNRTSLAFLSAILICFLFSLSIEIRQIWLPGRDSSLLDLLLNTGGGLTGALLSLKQHRLSGK